MFTNRKRMMAALTLLTMVFTLMAPQGRPAQAATVINEIRLTCNPASVGFDPANTEEQVADKIRHNTAIQTAGIEIVNGKGNTGLNYLNESVGNVNGIGEGTSKVNPSRKYYLYVSLSAASTYDWPDEVKALDIYQDYPVKNYPLSVYLNGKNYPDACIKHTPGNDLKLVIPFGPEMASCKAELSETAFTYDGKAHQPEIKSLTLYGKDVPKEYYSFSYVDANNNKVSSPKDAGKYYAVFTGKGMYRGSYRAAFRIGKPNTMKVEGKTVTVKVSKLKKKNQTVKAKKAVKVKKAIGKVTYAKASGNKKITVDANGRITIKKGLKRGKYKVKIKVTAEGNDKYLPLTKKITVTIVVK